MRYRIDWARAQNECILADLATYLDRMEKQIEDARNLDRARIGLEALDQGEYELEIQEHQDTFTKVLPRYLRYSFITLTCTVIETEIERICCEIGRRNSLCLTPRELHGDTLERSHLFLSRVAHLREPERSLWTSLSDLMKIRHCIVHTGGDITRSRDRRHLENLSRQSEGLSAVPEEWPSAEADNAYRYLELSHSFCTDALSRVRLFFKELQDSAGFGPGRWVADG